MIRVCAHYSVADPRRGGGVLCPSLFRAFFTKAKFTSKKLALNKYEICLKLNKMLEMAVLETQIFENFWGNMPPNSLRQSMVPLPLESPGSAPVSTTLKLPWIVFITNRADWLHTPRFHFCLLINCKKNEEKEPARLQQKSIQKMVGIMTQIILCTCSYIYRIWLTYGNQRNFFLSFFLYLFVCLFVCLFIHLFIYLQDSPTGAGINPQSTAPTTGSRIQSK